MIIAMNLPMKKTFLAKKDALTMIMMDIVQLLIAMIITVPSIQEQRIFVMASTMIVMQKLLMETMIVLLAYQPLVVLVFVKLLA